MKPDAKIFYGVVSLNTLCFIKKTRKNQNELKECFWPLKTFFEASQTRKAVTCR